MLVKTFILTIVLGFFIQSSLADWSIGKIWGNVVDKFEAIGDDAGKLVKKGVKEVENFGNNVAHDTKKIIKDAEHTIKKGVKEVENFGNNVAHDTKKIIKDAEHTIKKGVKEVEKFGNNVANDTKKFIKDAEKWGKKSIKEIEDFAKKTQNALNGFGNDLVRETKKVVDNVVGPTNKAYDEIFQKAKQAVKSFQNFSFLKEVCSAPIPMPPIVKNISSIKDEICENPIDLIAIKNRIQNSLWELKQKAVEKVVQFANEFLESIKTKVNQLKPVVLEKLSDTKKIFLEQYAKVKKVLNRFVLNLENPNEENVDKIINAVEKFRKLSINLIENGKNFLNDLEVSAADKKVIQQILNVIDDLKTIGQPIGNMKKNIVDGILGGVMRVVEIIETSYDKVKSYVTNLPKTIIKIDSDETGTFKDLKVLALTEADNIFKKIFNTAERTINNVIRIVETEIDFKKNMICTAINMKIKTLKKVGKFICNTLFDLDEEFKNIFNNIDTAEDNLIGNIKIAEQHIRNYLKAQSNDTQNKLYSDLKKNLLNELNNVKNHKILNMDLTREFRKSMYEFTKLLDNIDRNSGETCTNEILSELPHLERNLQKNVKVCAEDMNALNENEDSTELINIIDESLRNFQQCAGVKKVKIGAIALQGNQCIEIGTDEIRAFVVVKRDDIIYAKTKFMTCINENVNKAQKELENVLQEADKCSNAIAADAA